MNSPEPGYMGSGDQGLKLNDPKSYIIPLQPLNTGSYNTLGVIRGIVRLAIC